MIKWFSQISSKDINTCWGKWASLWEMTQAGFPVPNGFILTTKAFWLNSHERDKEILHAFDELNCKFVAVRSSGTKEDGIDDSFAGQFDTYLFVTKDKLIEQVIECHNSIDSERIISYCEAKNINRKDIKVAVVIQKMVNSDIAGVCFTINPVTWETEEIMIEAGYGVWEAVVSGMITPDNYIVNKITNTIQKTISEQAKKIVIDIEQGWTKEEDIESTIISSQKLSDNHILELTEYAKKIEKHYWKPMDTEWAVEDKKIYILQARPITTIWKKEDNWLHIVKSFIENNKNQNLYPVISNVSPFLWWSEYNKYYRYDKHYKDRTPIDCLIIRQKDSSFWYIPENKLISLSREMFVRSFNEINLIDDLTKKTQNIKDEIDSIYEKNNIDQINSLQEVKLIKLLIEVRELIWNFNWFLQFCLIFDKKICKDELEKLNKYPWDEIFENLRDKWTILADLSFEKDGALYLAKKYIDHNDFNYIVELSSFLLASYADVPSIEESRKYIKENLQFLNKKKETEQFIIDIEKEHIEKQTNFDVLISSLSYDQKHIVKYMQSIMWLRDKRKNIFNKGFVIMKRCAEKLFDISWIDKKYITYTLVSEISKWVVYLKSIKENIEKRENWFIEYIPYDWDLQYSICNVKNCVDYINAKWYINNYGNDTKIVTGECWSKWFVVWKVQIIRDQKIFHTFIEWNILVTWMTRPEYVPLMKKASAIITDEWWITCHAAIISREMWKPCIIGTKFWTKILKDWDIIEVDADNGIVKILDNK